MIWLAYCSIGNRSQCLRGRTVALHIAWLVCTHCRYRAHWLNSIPDDSPDKPYTTKGNYVLHIVESWEPPQSNTSTTKDMHVYTDAAAVEFFVNGVSQGKSSPTNPDHSNGHSWAEFPAVTWANGNVKANALDAQGNVLATTARHTSGVKATLALQVDVPSKLTGTGAALLLDGHDAGMIRASVLDSNGRVVHMATDNITFTIVSGLGAVIGAHNGDPSSHTPNHAPWRAAYHGLVRCVIQVTKDCSSSPSHRRRIREIDGAASHSMVAVPDGASCTAQPIVVQASAEGFKPVQISIPTSIDAVNDGVFAVAEATAGQPVVIN